MEHDVCFRALKVGFLSDLADQLSRCVVASEPLELDDAAGPTGQSNTAYWAKQPRPNSQRPELQTGSSLDAEGFLGGVDVSQTKVDVGANALHRFHGEATTQIVGEGTRRRQAKAVPVGQRKATSIILCNAWQHTPLTLFSQTPAITHHASLLCNTCQHT